MRHWFRALHAQGGGNFRAVNDELLNLFSSPDARGPRPWQTSFGLEPERRDCDRSAFLSVANDYGRARPGG
jgi:hypothetical protein